MASSTRDLDPHRLDVGAFASARGELAGDWAADRLTRLTAATLAPEDGTARSTVGWRTRAAMSSTSWAAASSRRLRPMSGSPMRSARHAERGRVIAVRCA